MAEQEYTPTEAEMRLAYPSQADPNRGDYDTVLAAELADFDRGMAKIKAQVRADERAKRPDREQLEEALYRVMHPEFHQSAPVRVSPLLSKLVDAVLALEPEAREVTEKGYLDAWEITVEVLSDLLAEVGIVTPGNEGRLSKFASAIVQKVETRLPAREVTDAEVEAAASGMWDRHGRSGLFPHAPVHLRSSFLADARAALEAAREVSRG